MNKIILMLYPDMPLTHRVPINPATGKMDGKLTYELSVLATDISCCCEDENERNELRAKYKALTNCVEFMDSPLILQDTFMYRAGALCSNLTLDAAATEARSIKLKSFQETIHLCCHPDNLKEFPADVQSKIEVRYRKPYLHE